MFADEFLIFCGIHGVDIRRLGNIECFLESFFKNVSFENAYHFDNI